MDSTADFRVYQSQIVGNKVISIDIPPRSVFAVEAHDRVHALQCLEVREPPFLCDVLRTNCFGADDKNQPVASLDRVVAFLTEREVARGHRRTVEPHFKSSRPKAFAQPEDESLVVVARVGEKEANGHVETILTAMAEGGH
jgi:hypothetical protein